MSPSIPSPGEIIELEISQESESLANSLLRHDALNGKIASVSFAAHSSLVQKNGWLQARYHEDGDISLSDFLSFNSVFRINPFQVGAKRPMSKKDFLAWRREVVALFELSPLLESPVIALSNGETRRALLARAILKRPRVLILHDPFSGLDAHQRSRLKEILLSLAERKFAIILLCRNKDEFLSQRRKGAEFSGNRKALSAALRLCDKKGNPSPSGNRKTLRAPVIEIANLNLSLGPRKLFSNFSWTVREGERWVLKGPNGSGKTTLLSLVTGDNPRAYACPVKVFGLARMPGVTLASIRSRIGLASPEMQAYLAIPPRELVSNAIAAKPGLLLLDEPFMNMSQDERREATREILAFLDRHPRVAAILVSHRDDEIPTGFDLLKELQ